MKKRVIIPIFSLTFLLFSAGSGKVKKMPEQSVVKIPHVASTKLDLTAFIETLYKDCKLKEADLNFNIFKKAVVGYLNIKKQQIISQNSIISVIDYSKPSTQKRLWIVDLHSKKLLEHSLVAHGRNSGDNLAIKFSNKLNSNMSSLGFYKTGKIYYGKHGKSLVLHGLDKNYNSNAQGRSVVMHAADYVCEDFIKTNGRLGRSHGCPAISPEESDKIIRLLEGGSCLFIYHPEFDSGKSDFLNESTVTADYSEVAGIF